METEKSDVDLVAMENDVEEGRGGSRTRSCGWFSWRPDCLRCFATPPWLLSTVCAYLFFQSMAVNGMVDGSQATLQRRFNLSSFKTGLLPAVYDVFAAVLVVFIGYFGITANKPRLLAAGMVCIGLGSIVFALPHFTTGPYVYSDRNSSDVCVPSIGYETTSPAAEEDAPEISSLSWYLYIFIVSKCLFAVGGPMGYCIGYAFVDESVTTEKTGIYLGLLAVFSVVGPSVGFVLSGVLLSVYTDFDSLMSVSIDQDDGQWVGAWWLGFVFCAIISFIIAVPISCYPPELPDTAMIRAQRESQAHANSDRAGKASGEEFCKSWRDFPTAGRMMLRNPTFIAVTMASTSENLLLTGLGSFLPILLENQFGMTSGTANIIFGSIASLAGGGSLFVGGWLVKRFQLKVPGMLKLIMVTVAVNGLTAFAFFLACPEIPLAGVYRRYEDTSVLVDVQLNDACNSRCQCSTTTYSPVCGSNDVMYFSPCFAGCQGHSDGDKVSYDDCVCIQDYSLTLNDSALATAVPGRCGSYCTQMYIFLVCLVVMIVTVFMDKVALTNTILRSVPDGQQSFALGIYGFTVRMFGSVPGPIIFGSLIDSTCTLWYEAGGQRGQCWFHSRTDLSLYAILFGLSLKSISFVMVLVAYKLYRPPEKAKADSGKDTSEEKWELNKI